MEKKVNLWGYTISESGKVFGVRGAEMKQRPQIRIRWNNTKGYRVVSYARFVYYAFHYEEFDIEDETIVIKQINGNKRDYNIKNLIAISEKYIKQGEYSALSKLTDEEVEEIKQIYENKKAEKKNDPMTNISYRQLAEKYGVSHTMIAGIVKGTLRNKENYILK